MHDLEHYFRAVSPNRIVALQANWLRSRRDGFAAEIVVTVPTSSVLPAFHPSCEPPPKGPCGGERLGLIRSGEDQKRPNPAAFYWHLYRGSASVPVKTLKRLVARPHACARAAGSLKWRPYRHPKAVRTCACASPSMSPTFRRTPERFCGSAPASASRPISSSRPASPHRPRLPPRRNGLPRRRRDHAAPIVAKFRGLAAAASGHRLLLFTTAASRLLSGFPLPGGRYPAVRTRIGGSAGNGPRRGRCRVFNPDAARPALSQRRGRRGDGGWRGAAGRPAGWLFQHTVTATRPSPRQGDRLRRQTSAGSLCRL